MRPVLAVLAVFSATSCYAQPAPAQEQLAFWMDAGDHGIVQCDGAAARTVVVAGKEADLASCVATLERDLDDERAARARGDISDSFPSLQSD
ncbi:hypothetical protein IA69_31520 [Massilia sp. JS1662]|nr:hypothetical protein [Massilia sp. JS1662]KGF78238.1 hypothetical protein IA69_31520 [Massilia sp. JS1662]